MIRGGKLELLLSMSVQSFWIEIDHDHDVDEYNGQCWIPGSEDPPPRWREMWKIDVLVVSSSPMNRDDCEQLQTLIHQFEELPYWQVSRKVSQGSGKIIPLSSDVASKLPPIYLLRDEDQPFILEVKFGVQSYRFEFYDTASPQTWQLLKPDVIIICFDISSRITLIDAQRTVSLF